jgi:phosphoribosylanthranilate isomerase
VTSGIDSFLLTHSDDPQAIVDILRSVRPTGVQLQSDELSLEGCAYVKTHLPTTLFLKKLSIREDDDQCLSAKALADSGLFDGIVLDTAGGASSRGGTGRTHNWNISAALVRMMSEQRFILAGGITPENIHDAINVVHPFGVDVMSGVSDAPGVKNLEKVERLISAVKAPDTTLRN